MAGKKKNERTQFDEEAVRMEVQASLSKYQDDDAIIVHLGFAPNNLVNDPRLHENYLTFFACDASHIKTKEGGNVFDSVLKDANGQVLNPKPHTLFALLDSYCHTQASAQTLNLLPSNLRRQALARRKSLDPRLKTLKPACLQALARRKPLDPTPRTLYPKP